MLKQALIVDDSRSACRFLAKLLAEHGVESLAICTVSDDIRTGEALTSDERATTFDEMIGVALETVRASE